MTNIFIFTASNAEAKKHLHDTVENPIPPEKVGKHFSGNELTRVREIGEKQHGYYAWGARPGSGNIATWNRMQLGDLVIVYQNGFYTFLSKVLFKAKNKNFAIENWGKSPENDTREYMYLLEQPTKLKPPQKASAVSKYLPGRYMGFTRLSDDRLDKIAKDYLSLEDFVNRYFPNAGIEPPPTPGVAFWWVNQGHSYSEDQGYKFIWAPLERGDGANPPSHWKNIQLVKKGDVIFNFARLAIQAISTASDKGYRYNQEFKEWKERGIRVDIVRYPIDPTIPKRTIKQNIDLIKKALVDKNHPFDKNGNIKQGYLYEFSLEAAKKLREIYGRPFPDPIERLMDEPKPPKNNDEYLFDLLEKKKQIILYGPPGTGKTYRGKIAATSFLELRGCVPSSTSSLERIISFINSLEGIKEKPESSMRGYYSISKKSNKRTGLVWVETPDKKGVFKIHLRKEKHGEYPKELSGRLSNYIKNGWGGYPELKVNNEQDADISLSLIKFAFENL
jgi:hypothetical protein